MLGSPHGQLQRLENELENKIVEITAIKKKLEVQLRDRQQASSMRHALRDTSKQITGLLTSIRCLLSDLSTDIQRQSCEWSVGLQNEITQHISALRQNDRKEVMKLSSELFRITAQNKSLAAEVAELKDCRHTEFNKRRSQANISTQEETSIDALKLRKCDITSPAHKLVSIEKSSEDMSRSPALEFPSMHLETINEEEEAISSGYIAPKTKIVKVRPTNITSANIVKTQPSENCVIIPTNRAESQRPEISKDLSKVCIEDLAKMIDKVTPSKIAIKSFADRIVKKASLHEESDDHENAADICARMRPWGKQGSHSHMLQPRERSMTIIELGGKRRSSSKEGGQSKQKESGGLRNRDTNIVRSQSKQKIKVTVKDNIQLSKSRTITRTADRKSSYNSNYHPRPVMNLSLLHEQLSKLQIYVGDRRYELRYEGTKKEQQRCGTGKLEYINGLMYQGEFREDVRHGYGVLSMNGKDIYQGFWQGDQLHGKGSLKNIQYVSKRKLPEESILRTITFDGELKGNTLHGAGCITLSNGHKLQGYFYNNVPQGDLTPVQRVGCAETSQFLF